MGLAEYLAAGEEGIVTREVEGIGPVRFRILTAGEVLKFLKLPGDQCDLATVAAAVLGEDGKPFFASPAKVAAVPWPKLGPLWNAAVEVNSPTLRAAGKKNSDEPAPADDAAGGRGPGEDARGDAADERGRPAG